MNQSASDMPFTAIQLRDFAALFSGRQSAYGLFTINRGAHDGGKQSGKASTVTAPITQDLYAKHLMGSGTGIGIVPIKENGTCSFSVIDLDIYTPAVKKNIFNLIQALNAPLCVFTSKSGGLHMYAFFEEEIPAKKAIHIMQRFKEVLGLSKDTEVFPKQAKLEEGSIGNWINLPYYNVGTKCKRNLLSSEGTPIHDLDIALSHCLKMKQSETEFERFFLQLPLQDAPPCLQRIYISGNITHRNDYLLSLAHYYKAKHGVEEFDTYVLDANQRLNMPLPTKEVISTVIASSKKKEYKYACSKEPLCLFCNRKECEKREFGITSRALTSLSFGDFRQIMTDPPYYEWVVDDVVLRLNSEDELINQTAFRKQCIRHLHTSPNKINEPAWNDVVNRALANVIVITVDIEEDASPGAVLRKNILEYVRKRTLATSREGIFRNLVYKDISADVSGFLFLANGLLDFLTGIKQMKPKELVEIRDKLVLLGGEPLTISIKGQPCKCWKLPLTCLDNVVAPDVQEKIDFLDSLGIDE